MNEYIYILAPKNEQNEAVFEQFTTLYPELIEQGRERKNIWSRSENDVIIPNPEPLEPPTIEHYGILFLMIKAGKSQFSPEMLDHVFEPQTFDSSIDSDIKKMRAEFWI